MPILNSEIRSYNIIFTGKKERLIQSLQENNALVAYINTRARNQAVHLILRFAAERASQLFSIIIFTHCLPPVIWIQLPCQQVRIDKLLLPP